MDDHPIRFDSTPTYADFAEAIAVSRQCDRTRLWTSRVTNVVLVLSGLAGVVWREPTLIGLALGGLVLPVLVGQLVDPLVRRRAWSRQVVALGAGYEVTVRHNGVSFLSDRIAGDVPWDRLRKFIETERQFVLLARGRPRRGLILIPTRDVPDHTLVEVRRVLRARVAEDRPPKRLVQRKRVRVGRASA